MSATATKLTLDRAIDAADRFRAMFTGLYERWEFAGSIRRRKPHVGDVEHVVIPKWIEDLLGESSHVNRVRAHMVKLCDAGVLAKTLAGSRPRFGHKYLRVYHDGIPHDVFFCTPDTWGNILAIRTGSSDFSRTLMMRLRDRGHCHEHGRLFKLVPAISSTGVPIHERHEVPCIDEETIFRAAGFDQVPAPEGRT